MAHNAFKGPLFTIASGAQNSNAIPIGLLSAVTAFSLSGILTPDSATHTYVIQVSHDDGTTWVTLNSNGVDVAAPPTGYSYTYAMPPMSQIRIRDKTAVTTGITTFQMYCEEAIYNTGF